MYELKAGHDIIFMICYGGVTVFYVLVCLYLLFRRGNAFSHTVQPPKELRYWAAGVAATFALSNVWWLVLGSYIDDLVLSNAISQGLDALFVGSTLMPLLIRMFQNRRRPIWPVGVAVSLGVLIPGVIGVMMHDSAFQWILVAYIVLLNIVFFTYMVYAVRQYGQWLRNNFANLENKEIGSCLGLLGGVFLFYLVYMSNFGELWIEYLSMVFSVVLIVVMLWRVETLQELVGTDESELDRAFDVAGDAVEEPVDDDAAMTSQSQPFSLDISSLLEQHCEATQLYLHSDLTLEQLSRAIGTNRTYLSHFFTQQGTTYNAYVNRLRVEHFVRLYRESLSQLGSVTARQLAFECGFRSYRTFSNAFKSFMGQSVITWMKSQ